MNKHVCMYLNICVCTHMYIIYHFMHIRKYTYINIYVFECVGHRLMSSTVERLRHIIFTHTNTNVRVYSLTYTYTYIFTLKQRIQDFEKISKKLTENAFSFTGIKNFLGCTVRGSFVNVYPYGYTGYVVDVCTLLRIYRVCCGLIGMETFETLNVKQLVILRSHAWVQRDLEGAGLNIIYICIDV